MGNLLTSFAPQIHAIGIGATGGLGRAFVNTLADDERVLSVLALSRVTAGLASDCVKTIAIDIEDEASIEVAARSAADHEPTYQLVIVATGVLHAAGLSPVKSWKALSADALATAYMIMGEEFAFAHAEERGIAVFLIARKGDAFSERGSSAFKPYLGEQ